MKEEFLKEIYSLCWESSHLNMSYFHKMMKYNNIKSVAARGKITESFSFFDIVHSGTKLLLHGIRVPYQPEGDFKTQKWFITLCEREDYISITLMNKVNLYNKTFASKEDDL